MREKMRGVFIWGLFGSIFSLCFCVGRHMYLTHDIGGLFSSAKEVIAFCVLGIIFPLLYIIFYNIGFPLFRYKQWEIWSIEYRFLVLSLFIIITWIPCLLAYYPGIMAYDSPNQTEQVFGGGYTKYHPPLHTFIWHVSIKIGEMLPISGLTVYCVLQMIFLSGVFAKVICFLIDNEATNIMICLCIAFYSLNPVMALLSINMTKDVWFAGFFTLFIVQFNECIKKDFNVSKVNLLCFGILELLCCLFRNNAIYVFVLFAPMAIWRIKKKTRICLCVCAPILIYLFIMREIYPALGVSDGDAREALSVPIQQIAYVVTHEENIPEELVEEIDKYLPYDELAERYNPRLADNVKKKFRTEIFLQEKKEFMNLWWNLFLLYPKDYVNSFLTLNLPSWYLLADTVDPFSQRKYIETKINKLSIYPVERASVLPDLLELYEAIASYELFDMSFLLKIVYNISVPIWILMLGIFGSWQKKKDKNMMCFLPAILLWITHLAGPVSNFRYMFPIYVLYPVYLFLGTGEKNNARENKRDDITDKLSSVQ